MKILGKISAGSNNTNSYNDSQAFGKHTSTTKEGQCVVGEYNDTTDTNSQFIVGAGTSSATSNAFCIGKNMTASPITIKGTEVPADKCYIVLGSAVMLEDDLASVANLATALEGLL